MLQVAVIIAPTPRLSCDTCSRWQDMAGEWNKKTVLRERFLEFHEQLASPEAHKALLDSMPQSKQRSQVVVCSELESDSHW